MTENTQLLYEELHRLQDLVNEVDPSWDDYEATIEHFEHIIECTLDELRDCGEEV